MFARRLAAACLCALALGTTTFTVNATAQAPASTPVIDEATTGAAGGGVKPKARPASRTLRRAYAQWRKRLHRYGAYVGRNLLTTA
ncbi:MAG TPA: hypothetical protein VI111_02180, partial [Thermoleophilaceae bacterium]